MNTPERVHTIVKKMSDENVAKCQLPSTSIYKLE